jgi:hypothetical protein
MDREKLFKSLRHLRHPKPQFVQGNVNFFPHECLSAACAKWAGETAVAFLNAFYNRLGIKSVLEPHFAPAHKSSAVNASKPAKGLINRKSIPAETRQENTMASPIGKVTYDDLGKFLRGQGELWQVYAPLDFERTLPHLPVTTSELIDAICLYAHELGYVYVFSYDEGVDEAISRHWPDNVDSINAEQLERFVIRSAHGRDFLWISPTDEDASNATYLTLLLHDSADDDAET